MANLYFELQSQVLEFLQNQALGDFFKPCPSRAKAGFKKSPSG
jgi:hypothetical protein